MRAIPTFGRGRPPTLGLRKLNKSIEDLQGLRKDIKSMDSAVKKELTKLYQIRRDYRPTINMMDKIINAKAELINQTKQLQLEQAQAKAELIQAAPLESVQQSLEEERTTTEATRGDYDKKWLMVRKNRSIRTDVYTAIL